MGKSKDSNTSVNGNNSNAARRKTASAPAAASAPAQKGKAAVEGNSSAAAKTVTAKGRNAATVATADKTAADRRTDGSGASNKSPVPAEGRRMVTPDGRTVIVKTKPTAAATVAKTSKDGSAVSASGNRAAGADMQSAASGAQEDVTYKRLPDGRLVKVIRRQVPKSQEDAALNRTAVPNRAVGAPASNKAAAGGAGAARKDVAPIDKSVAATSVNKGGAIASETKGGDNDKSAVAASADDKKSVKKGKDKANSSSAIVADNSDRHSAENKKKDKEPKAKVKATKPDKKKKHSYTSELKRVEPDPEIGLTDEQVEERTVRGYNNVQPNIVTKSYLRIFRSNVMTLFNALNFFLAALILVFGSLKNMTFIILVIFNMIVGIVQEVRSKLVLEKMSLLNVPKVSVVRGGECINVDISEVVLDDIMEIHAGEQIASDAVVVSGECEVNESLLTGEQDDIHKVAGAELLSGSIVQAGTCRARVVKVGKDNFAATILSEAKKYKKTKSQLMRSINWIIRIVTIAIFPLGILMYLTNCAEKGLGYLDMFNIVSSDMAAKVSSVVTNSVASVVGMIPEGLVMMTSIALAVGVIKLARKQTLVQDLFSIETLARVDMLCLDKTGTITEGSMQVEDIKPYSDQYGDVEDIMSSMVAALGTSGSTFEAIGERFKSENLYECFGTVPFSSARKWSGADFGAKGRFIVGAPEFVLKERYETIREDVEEYGRNGYRVLVLVYTQQAFVETMSVAEMRPVALIILSDKIRENAEQTLRYFAEQGVNLKVISGDNPITVSKVAERAGLIGAEKYIDATTLTADEDIYEACDKYVVFGRVTPKQKKILVTSLKAKGYTVGMTGDGVNDVMALKEADCSIAMASGSEAARNVAQLVLMNSDFASLPSVVAEGRRVINNIERVASLFLVKTTFSVVLTLMCIILQLSYPFVPIQLTLISGLFVGMPSFFLALEPNNRKVTGSFLSKVFSKALPAGLTIALMVTVISILYHDIGIDVSSQIATMAFYVTGLTALLVLLQVCYPYTKMRLFLIFLALMGLIFAVSVDWTREFFSINSLTSDMITKLAIMMICIAPCMLVMRVEIGAVKELIKEIKNFFIRIKETAGMVKSKIPSAKIKPAANNSAKKSAATTAGNIKR
ncbi:MAG: HAD-IC family P-type ATPase [Clostridia bacterium]|nr:HAD-IC family P-type ATPase [Clostridia bacterium]